MGLEVGTFLRDPVGVVYNCDGSSRGSSIAFREPRADMRNPVGVLVVWRVLLD